MFLRLFYNQTRREEKRMPKTRPFSELREKMSPKSKRRAEELASRILKPTAEEKYTIGKIIMGILRNQSMTVSELVATVFSGPYNFDSGFGMTTALVVVSEILSELKNIGVLVPEFYPDEQNITIVTKWSVR